jgi:hypothetical protein
MGIFKKHWGTGLLVLAAGILIFISVASFSATDPNYQNEDRITGIITAVAAVAVLAWTAHRVWRQRQGTRSGRAQPSLDTQGTANAIR